MTYGKYRWILCLQLLILAVAMKAGAQLPEQIVAVVLLPGSSVTVKGASNVNFFECISSSAAVGKNATIRMAHSRSSVSFTGTLVHFKVKTLECGHEAMNEHLYESMKSDEFPEIWVTVLEASSTDLGPIDLKSWEELEVKTAMEIAGVRRIQYVKVSAVKTGGHRFRITGEHFLRMSSFGITPPTALFGMIKVKDGITVAFNLEVEVTQSAP